MQKLIFFFFNSKSSCTIISFTFSTYHFFTMSRFDETTVQSCNILEIKPVNSQELENLTKEDMLRLKKICLCAKFTQLLFMH